MAESAGSTERSTWRGLANSPACTARTRPGRSRLRTAACRSEGNKALRQAVNVRPRAKLVKIAPSLFRRHVRRRPHRRARQCFRASTGRRRQEHPFVATRETGLCLAKGLGEPPVDHKGLAIFADDHIARFDIAVENSPRVSVVNGIADVEEPPEQPAELELSRRPPGSDVCYRCVFLRLSARRPADSGGTTRSLP